MQCDKLLAFSDIKTRYLTRPQLVEENRASSYPPQTNKKLSSFEGLANFYSRYLPKYSELIEPFDDLRKRIVTESGLQNKKSFQ